MVDYDVIRSPEENIVFLDRKLDIPNKIKLNQRKRRHFSKYKYNAINQLNSSRLFDCEAKSYMDKFIISDPFNKNTLYTFQIIKRAEDILVLKIMDGQTEEEKSVSLQREESIISSSFKVTFLNEKTKKKEKLYIYSDDYRTHIYYDKKEEDGGALICKAVKDRTKKNSYSIEISSKVDKMFMFILILGVTRYLRVNVEYWY